MNKWNIYFTIKGPAGITEAPNSFNPVECTNMASLLRQLMDNLPTKAMGIDLEITGLRIEKVKTTQEIP